MVGWASDGVSVLLTGETLFLSAAILNTHTNSLLSPDQRQGRRFPHQTILHFLVGTKDRPPSYSILTLLGGSLGVPRAGGSGPPDPPTQRPITSPSLCQSGLQAPGARAVWVGCPAGTSCFTTWETPDPVPLGFHEDFNTETSVTVVGPW